MDADSDVSAARCLTRRCSSGSINNISSPSSSLSFPNFFRGLLGFQGIDDGFIETEHTALFSDRHQQNYDRLNAVAASSPPNHAAAVPQSLPSQPAATLGSPSCDVRSPWLLMKSSDSSEMTSTARLVRRDTWAGNLTDVSPPHQSQTAASVKAATEYDGHSRRRHSVLPSVASRDTTEDMSRQVTDECPVPSDTVNANQLVNTPLMDSCSTTAALDEGQELQSPLSFSSSSRKMSIQDTGCVAVPSQNLRRRHSANQILSVFYATNPPVATTSSPRPAPAIVHSVSANPKTEMTSRDCDVSSSHQHVQVPVTCEDASGTRMISNHLRSASKWFGGTSALQQPVNVSKRDVVMISPTSF